jgi:CRISPR-associated endoribonuclease Cas6
MRLLLRLNPETNTTYDNDYHYHLQSAIYSMIRQGGLEELHEKRGYKLFCFSNIFPYRARFERGIEENLLISTPDPELSKSVLHVLRSMIGKRNLRMGRMEFEIAAVDGPLEIHLVPGTIVKVRSSTPIIVRIPSARYGDYGIKTVRPYVFWRETIPLEAFVKQLRDNMEKKISEYGSIEGGLGYKKRTENELASPPLPEVLSYRYQKMVSKPITIKGESQQVIGSLWEFEFVPQTQIEASNLEFAIESGFGERNSLGFGFMNSI